jgi:hypothetical protein
MTWLAFDNGNSIGNTGSEGGRIVVDDEHPEGARITLETDGGTAPFSITCGIYGWFVHTRFFGKEAEAQETMEAMKDAMAHIIAAMPDGDTSATTAAIEAFVERFP